MSTVSTSTSADSNDSSVPSPSSQRPQLTTPSNMKATRKDSASSGSADVDEVKQHDHDDQLNNDPDSLQIQSLAISTRQPQQSIIMPVDPNAAIITPTLYSPHFMHGPPQHHPHQLQQYFNPYLQHPSHFQQPHPHQLQLQHQQQHQQQHPHPPHSHHHSQEPHVSSNIYVSCLPLNWTEADFAHFFSQFGVVILAKILVDATTQQSRGAGFIHYDRVESAWNAIQRAHMTYPPHPALDANGAQKPLNVKFAHHTNPAAKENGNGTTGGSNGAERSHKGGRGHEQQAKLQQQQQQQQAYEQQMILQQQHQQPHHPPPVGPHQNGLGHDGASAAPDSDGSVLPPAASAPNSNLNAMTMYVANVPRHYSREQIDSLFSSFGKIVNIKMLTVPMTDQFRGVAFVQFRSRQNVQNAINAMNGQMVEGSEAPLQCKFSKGQRTGPSGHGSPHQHQPQHFIDGGMHSHHPHHLQHQQQHMPHPGFYPNGVYPFPSMMPYPYPTTPMQAPMQPDMMQGAQPQQQQPQLLPPGVFFDGMGFVSMPTFPMQPPQMAGAPAPFAAAAATSTAAPSGEFVNPTPGPPYFPHPYSDANQHPSALGVAPQSAYPQGFAYPPQPFPMMMWSPQQHQQFMLYQQQQHQQHQQQLELQQQAQQQQQSQAPTDDSESTDATASVTDSNDANADAQTEPQQQ